MLLKVKSKYSTDKHCDFVLIIIILYFLFRQQSPFKDFKDAAVSKRSPPFVYEVI